MRGSHGLSAQRTRRMKSSRPEVYIFVHFTLGNIIWNGHLWTNSYREQNKTEWTLQRKLIHTIPGKKRAVCNLNAVFKSSHFILEFSFWQNKSFSNLFQELNKTHILIFPWTSDSSRLLRIKSNSQNINVLFLLLFQKMRQDFSLQQTTDKVRVCHRPFFLLLFLNLFLKSELRSFCFFMLFGKWQTTPNNLASIWRVMQFPLLLRVWNCHHIEKGLDWTHPSFHF